VSADATVRIVTLIHKRAAVAVQCAAGKERSDRGWPGTGVLFAAAIAWLASCTPASDGRSAPAQPPAPGVSEVVGDTRGVTIRLSDWHLTESHWERSIREMVTDFERDNPSIKVDLVPVPYAEKEALYIKEIQGGGGPDLIHLHGLSIRSFMEKGFLLDLTERIGAEPGTAWGGSFIETWYPQTIELIKYRDRYFGLPGDFMAMVLFYNKKLFREAGLDPARPPRTWDEFLLDARALTRDRNRDGTIDTWGFGIIGAIDPGFELRFTPILLSYGGSYLTADGKCSALDSAAAVEAFEFYVGLSTEHKVVPPGVTSETPTTLRMRMAKEQIAMKIGSGWTVPIVDGFNPGLKAAETLAAAPVPSVAGRTVSKPTTAWISAWMINRNSPHPEEAWRLLRFMTSQKAEQRWFVDARVLSARRDVSGGLEDRGLRPFGPLVDDPFARVIAAELPRSQFVPQIKEWPQIIEVLNRAAQASFRGAKPARQALRDAHEEINTILSVYRSAGEVCRGN
jgi:multiple sugar transport system substrate-binding protein